MKHTQTNIAFDFSLSSPSICIQRGYKYDFYNTQPTKKFCGIYQHENITIDIRQTPKPNSFTTRFDRYQFLLDWVKDCLPEKVDFIAIEHYSYGSLGKHSSLMEIGGLLRMFLHQKYNNCKINEIPPTTVKKYFSGKGNAKKPEMIDAFFKKTDVDFSEVIGNGIGKTAGLITDLVDAYAVLETGLDTL